MFFRNSSYHFAEPFVGRSTGGGGNSFFRRFSGPLLMLAITLIGFTIIAAGGLIYFSSRRSGEPPTVAILQPHGAQTVTSGQGLILVAEGQAADGVQRVDFLVDGILVEQHFADSPGESPLQASFPWFSSGIGVHELSAVAYDDQDRASEPAAVQVGVQRGEVSRVIPGEAALDEEGAGEPQASAPGGGGEVGSGEAPAGDGGQAGQLPGGGAGEAGGEAEGEQPGAGAAPPPGDEGGQPLEGGGDGQPPAGDEQPPMGDVTPPQINRLDIDVALQGAHAIVTLAAEAQDDRGVDRLELSMVSDGGEQNSFTQICLGELLCSFGFVMPLEEGMWSITVQAFDTSGLASQPEMRMAQVIAGDGQPPAAAEHDASAALQERFRDIVGPLPVELPFEPIDLWVGMFGGGDAGQGQPAGGDAVQVEGECTQLTVEPRPGGNFISMEITCSLEIEGPDRFIYPYIDKNIANTGDDGIEVRVPEWFDPERTAFSEGDTLTWLDEDITCGTQYRYRGRVNEAAMTDRGAALGASMAFAETLVEAVPCAPGSMGDVDLRAEEHPDGIIVRWHLIPGEDWPDDIPAEGLAFVLTRFTPLTGDLVELQQFDVRPEQVPNDGRYEFVDDQAPCENQHWYTLAAIRANIPPEDREHSSFWLLRSSAAAPVLSCAGDSLGAIALEVTSAYVEAGYRDTRAEADIPAGFNWPEDENVFLQLVGSENDYPQNVCEDPPCPWLWSVIERIPITEEVRQSGLALRESDASLARCGGREYRYRLEIVIQRRVEAENRLDYEVVDQSSVASVTTPPCPPPPPDILRLIATNDCPGSVPRCVIIEWEPYQQPGNDTYYFPAARIVVERIVGALDDTEFPVELNQTHYVDTAPFERSFELANGEVAQVCNHDVLYRMVAYSAEGHTSGASPLDISTPTCDEPWSVVEVRRR